MPTNLALDDRLVAEAKRLGHHASKRAAVNEALAEYVARRKQRDVVALFGKLVWDPSYDYKVERRRPPRCSISGVFVGLRPSSI